MHNPHLQTLRAQHETRELENKPTSTDMIKFVININVHVHLT